MLGLDINFTSVNISDKSLYVCVTGVSQYDDRVLTGIFLDQAIH
jgi:hypothetical protein